MNETIESVRRLILQNKKPSYQTTNNKEISVRCPYCGDSKKASSAHLYIEMAPPFKFHCKKCETSGVLSNSVLRDLGIFDSEIAGAILNAKKNCKDNSSAGKIGFSKKRFLKNTFIQSNQTSETSEYFNRRYGVNLDSEFISKKYKAILDAETFFRENNITIPKVNFNFEKAIGFISSDNSHVIFRDITGKQSLRYFNLNLYKEGNESKIYNIQTSVDLLSEKVRLVITEGIFDIIGVYEHFYKNTEKEKNSIFAAACGKGFNAVILNYIRQGFLDLEIEIYSDADVDISFYNRLKESSEYLKNLKITIFYNSLYNPETGFGKDYGTRKAEINLKKFII